MAEEEESARVIRQLRTFLGPRPAAPAEERCEFCGKPLAAEHSHVVHIERRNLLCTCRPCYLLFSSQGAAGGKVKAVPDRVVDLGKGDKTVFTAAQWDRLQVPVGLAFFFFNSSLGKTVAFYPSPAGATESLLPLETWEEVVREHPQLADLSADVEALLIWQSSEGSACLIAPIDACYELVGIVRRNWKGFHGGAEAWQAISAFFDALRARAR